MDIAIADDDSIKRRYSFVENSNILTVLFLLSFAREAMLNINAFFEFKQRTRHTHSFQLAQLIYHSQHLNDYFTLAQNVNTESNRRTSMAPSNDPVSMLIINEKDKK
jgi:hypothetical protein